MFRTYTSFHGLFWSLFGVTDLTRFSTKDRNLSITKETGEVLFAVFQVVAAIVAINMLIAMMSKSYDNITVRTSVSYRRADPGSSKLNNFNYISLSKD